MSWYWKQKPTWRKDLARYLVILGLCLLLIDCLSLGERGRGRERGAGFVWNWRYIDNGGGGHKNWNIFMDAICVSSLNRSHVIQIVSPTSNCRIRFWKILQWIVVKDAKMVNIFELMINKISFIIFKISYKGNRN